VTSQAGCPTRWRNAGLLRSWQRFHSVFEAVVYHGSDEHEWAFLSGRADAVADPASRMAARLATLPYRPVTLDAAAVAAHTVAPYTLRSAMT
jgi:spermidine synthase